MLTVILYALLSAACIGGGFFCLWLSFRRHQRQDIVYDNSAFFLMLFSCIALGSFVLYLLIAGEAEIALVPAVVAAICLLGLLSWHNEVIFFDETGFTRRDFLFRSRRCSYTDIRDWKERSLRQGRKRSEKQLVFYLEKGQFSLSQKAVNLHGFIDCVRSHGHSELML